MRGSGRALCVWGLGAILGAAAGFPPPASPSPARTAVELRAVLDRTSVSVGQPFTLTIEVSGEGIGSAVLPDPPDLSAFARFRGSSSSQNISIINGRMSATRASVSHYIAAREGSHTIPAVSMVFQGETFRSQPLSIEIVKERGGSAPPRSSAAAGAGDPGAGITPAESLEGNLFLKIEASPRRVYRYQPVTLTARLYTRVDLTNYGVTKTPELSNFWIENFDLPQPVRTFREEVDGRDFLVGEIQKSALFPTDEGTLTIPPMEVECQVRLRRRSTGSMLDRFFDDDFFDTGMFGRVERTRVASRPLTIEVLPLPELGRPPDFSGAVGRYRMEASLDRSKAETDEAVTLRVTISGTGNIKLLPEPKVAFPSDMETYPPKINSSIVRKGEAVHGSKSFEYVILPRRGGNFKLDPVSYSYFDPETEEYLTLRSPEFALDVVSGESAGDSVPRGLSREEIRFVGRDIRFIKEGDVHFVRIGYLIQRSVGFWLVMLFPLAVLSGVWIRRLRMDRMSADAALARRRRARKVARNRLAAARRLLKPDTESEFHAEISRAVLGYIADRLDLPAAGLDNARAGDLLNQAGISENITAALRECLEECDRQRFARGESGTEEMKSLFAKARSLIEGLERSRWEAGR